MNQGIRNTVIALLFSSFQLWVLAQSVSFRIEGTTVCQEIDLKMEAKALDSCLFSLGFDSVVHGLPVEGATRDGWRVAERTEDKLLLKRDLDSFDEVEWTKGEIQMEGGAHAEFDVNRSLSDFGFNTGRIKHVQDLSNGQTRFFLKGFGDARDVYLSGNFCNWSTLKYPMKKVDNGWMVEVNLAPGVWGYKFVVDGAWVLDPQNKDTYFDGYGHHWSWDQHANATFGNENNLYVKTNHAFRLPGHTEAQKVVLSGDFTAWNETNPQMRKTEKGWALPVYLKEGTHRYKFILYQGRWLPTAEWILDPANPNQRTDENGIVNSVLEIGEPTQFVLPGFSDAQQVILTGSFIDWSERELKMKRANDGWYLPYVLAPGNHSYKYIVDGIWMVDPTNPITVGEGDILNSVVSVGANTRFELKGFPNAKHVGLSGSFNGWHPSGFSMRRTENGWVIHVFVPKGKALYKFIVDGQWMPDPGNSQKEHNEFGEFNSVLWVE